MIPQDILDKLTPTQRSMLQSLQTSMEARGITITIVDNELIYTKNGEEIKRRPLTLLDQLRNAIVTDSPTKAPDA